MKTTRNPFVPVKLSRATQQQVVIHESRQTTTSKVIYITSLCHLLIGLIVNPRCSSILLTFICEIVTGCYFYFFVHAIVTIR